MAGPRGPGRFPVFATCPVVILPHGQTIPTAHKVSTAHKRREPFFVRLRGVRPAFRFSGGGGGQPRSRQGADASRGEAEEGAIGPTNQGAHAVGIGQPKGAEGATHSLVPEKRGWPPMSCQSSQEKSRIPCLVEQDHRSREPRRQVWNSLMKGARRPAAIHVHISSLASSGYVRSSDPLCGKRLILQRWIGAPDFPSEAAGTGLTSLKRKRRALKNAYHSMPFACASGLLQVKGVKKQ